MKKLLIAIMSMFLVAGCSGSQMAVQLGLKPSTSPSPQHSINNPPPCVALLVQTVQGGSSRGVYNCLDPVVREKFFNNNGWNSDQDIATAFQRGETKNDIVYYNGDPTQHSLCVQYDSNGGCMKSAPFETWDVYVTPLLDNGNGTVTRDDQDAFAMDISITSTGKIIQIA